MTRYLVMYTLVYSGTEIQQCVELPTKSMRRMLSNLNQSEAVRSGHTTPARIKISVYDSRIGVTVCSVTHSRIGQRIASSMNETKDLNNAQLSIDCKRRIDEYTTQVRLHRSITEPEMDNVSA